MAGRPLTSDPTKPLTTRLKGSLFVRLLAIATKERRKLSELVALVLEDYIADYEKKNGGAAPL